MIVGPQPVGGKFLDFVQCFEQVVGKPVIANRPVIALDVGVLLRLARLDEVDTDAAFCCPRQGHGADVFRAVVAPDRNWLSAPFNDPVERAYHAFGRQREVDLDSQTFAVEVVDHIEQTDPAPIGELVVHEVHRPTLIDRGRHRQRQRLFTYQTMTRLDPQVHLELAVNPVHTLVVPFEALDVAQVQEAQPKAPVALVVRQPHQPVGNEDVFRVQLGLVAITGLADAECLTRQLDRG